MNYKYAKVSTAAQNLDRQLDELVKIFQDVTFISIKNQEKTLIEQIIENFVANLGQAIFYL